MRGCTCEGAGTCRLCELEQRREEEEEEDDDIEIIEEPRPPPASSASSEEMSTTEYFLMTGKVRPPSQEAEEDDEDDIQVVEPQVPTTLNARGRGRGRGRVRGRARGARPVPVPLQRPLRPLRPPMYRDSLTLAPRQGFVQNQMRPVRPVRPVRAPAVSGGWGTVRSGGGAAQYNYQSPVPPPVRQQQRFRVAPARPVRPPRPAVPPGRRTVRCPAPPGQYRGERAVTNLHTAYYDRANQSHSSDVATQYYDNITQYEVVDLSDDDEEEPVIEEQEAALISRLPSGIRISKL